MVCYVSVLSRFVDSPFKYLALFATEANPRLRHRADLARGVWPQYPGPMGLKEDLILATCPQKECGTPRP